MGQDAQAESPPEVFQQGAQLAQLEQSSNWPRQATEPIDARI